VFRVLERLAIERKKKIKEAILTLKSDPVPFRELAVSKLRGY
jgi:hypothetical protein